MTTPTTTYFFTGQKVTITSPRFNGTATVKKHLQKNVDIIMDATGSPVRCHPSFLTPVTNDDGRPVIEPVAREPYVPMPMPGTIVRCTPESVARNPKLVGLWVFVGSTGDSARIFRVNNSDGRYWRVKANQMVKVNATVTEVPA